MAWETPELALYKHPRLLTGLTLLRRRVTQRVAPLKAWIATSPEPVPFADRGSLKRRPAGVGTWWGTAGTCAWLHVTGTVPSQARGAQLAAVLDLDGEALVLDATGAVVGAVSSRTTPVEEQAVTHGKTLVSLPPELLTGDRVDLWCDASFNGKLLPPLGAARIRRLELVTVDAAAEALYYDALAVAYGVLAAEGEAAKRFRSAFDAAVKLGRRGDVAAARAVLVPLLQGRPDASLTLSAVGHGHLDLAWLWPVRETRRKLRRTLTTQLDLLDAYPEHVFGLSQPQLLAWLEDDDPQLFTRVAGAIESGRIEPQGGMWVEADANLPSGESLVRQCLLGQGYWQSTFGRTLDTCWLPDVFGYNAQLPQILSKAGMSRFLTIKLSWNEHNDFGHRSFRWRGIDGSEVLVHMPPEGTYTSSATALALAGAKDKYPELASAPEALLVHGTGDGGGGPGRVHLELLRRSATLDGFPAVVRTEPAASFFDRLEAYRDALPVHTGELYLEKHQGTYTTQGRTKRWNRVLEHLLHDVEFVAATSQRPWPRELLRSAWRDVLLFQFHDILPGSAIGRVYAEADARYAELEAALAAEQVRHLEPGETPVFVNTLPVRRHGHARVGQAWATYDAAPFETAALRAWQGAAPWASQDRLSNGQLTATFDEAGALTSLLDHATGREALAGASNELVLYKDPHSLFDAWDIDFDYRRHPITTLRPESVEAFVDGPRAVRRATYRHGQSVITQEAVLADGVPYLLFRTHVDWHERWTMLRAEFAPRTWSDAITCDVQYGHLQRSTRDDTPAERAQFEVCAHQWVDISDADGGLALLNDGKYGHHAKNGALSLALLRSPVYPDPSADRGEHAFAYALYPHAGAVVDSDAAALAADLNAPALVCQGRAQAPRFAVTGAGVWLDVVKRAEDGDGFVLRLHEVRGRDAHVGVETPWGSEAVACDLLERALPDGRVDLGDLRFGPFEIKTFRIGGR